MSPLQSRAPILGRQRDIFVASPPPPGAVSFLGLGVAVAALPASIEHYQYPTLENVMEIQRIEFNRQLEETGNAMVPFGVAPLARSDGNGGWHGAGLARCA